MRVGTTVPRGAWISLVRFYEKAGGVDCVLGRLALPRGGAAVLGPQDADSSPTSSAIRMRQAGRVWAPSRTLFSGVAGVGGRPGDVRSSRPAGRRRRPQGARCSLWPDPASGL